MLHLTSRLPPSILAHCGAHDRSQQKATPPPRGIATTGTLPGQLSTLATFTRWQQVTRVVVTTLVKPPLPLRQLCARDAHMARRGE